MLLLVSIMLTPLFQFYTHFFHFIVVALDYFMFLTFVRFSHLMFCSSCSCFNDFCTTSCQLGLLICSLQLCFFDQFFYRLEVVVITKRRLEWCLISWISTFVNCFL